MESVLFDRYPVLEDEAVVLKKMTMDDSGTQEMFDRDPADERILGTGNCHPL